MWGVMVRLPGEKLGFEELVRLSVKAARQGVVADDGVLGDRRGDLHGEFALRRGDLRLGVVGALGFGRQLGRQLVDLSLVRVVLGRERRVRRVALVEIALRRGGGLGSMGELASRRSCRGAVTQVTSRFQTPKLSNGLAQDHAIELLRRCGAGRCGRRQGHGGEGQGRRRCRAGKRTAGNRRPGDPQGQSG